VYGRGGRKVTSENGGMERKLKGEGRRNEERILVGRRKREK
jgi:hypothetical protein